MQSKHRKFAIVFKNPEIGGHDSITGYYIEKNLKIYLNFIKNIKLIDSLAYKNYVPYDDFNLCFLNLDFG